MFGVPIDGPANVFGDHQSVVTNDVTTPDESTLQKKHNFIAHHLCREAVAAGTILLRQVLSSRNIAPDLSTSLHHKT